MTELTQNPVLHDSAALLIGYGFDLGVFGVDELVSYWSTHYPSPWLHAAILEALYQGRYKAISVGQILVIWRRRGQPLPHYNYEFERAVCGRFSPAGSSSASVTSTAPDGLGTKDSAIISIGNSTDDDLAVAQALDQSSAEENESAKMADNASNTGDQPGAVNAEIGGETSEIVPTTSAETEAIAPPSVPDALSLDANFSQTAASPQGDPDLNDTPLTPSTPLTPFDSPLEPVLSRLDLSSDPNLDDPESTDAAPEHSPSADLSNHDDALELWGTNTLHMPIHQYVPLIPQLETSTFYAKLRAVAYSDEML